jgi:hypothetical protein
LEKLKNKLPQSAPCSSIARMNSIKICTATVKDIFLLLGIYFLIKLQKDKCKERSEFDKRWKQENIPQKVKYATDHALTKGILGRLVKVKQYK